MENSESRLPLLRKEEYFSDYKDSSSGYDSPELSDSDSVSSVGSCDSISNLVPYHRQQQEVMNFSSTDNLCSTLRLIQQMPDLCDVTFLVGPRETPIHGVRAILGTRSCIFYQLILKHQSLMTSGDQTPSKSWTSEKSTAGLRKTWSDRLTIPVSKYEPEVFRRLVEFVHCGSINIHEDTVIGLYCGAVQFRLQDLSTACMDYVGRCLQGGRADQLLSSTRANSHHKASDIILDKINRCLEESTRNIPDAIILLVEVQFHASNLCATDGECNGVVFYPGNNTCAGTNTAITFETSNALPGAAYYRRVSATTSSTTIPQTSSTTTTTDVPTSTSTSVSPPTSSTTSTIPQTSTTTTTIPPTSSTTISTSPPTSTTISASSPTFTTSSTSTTTSPPTSTLTTVSPLTSTSTTTSPPTSTSTSTSPPTSTSTSTSPPTSTSTTTSPPTSTSTSTSPLTSTSTTTSPLTSTSTTTSSPTSTSATTSRRTSTSTTTSPPTSTSTSTSPPTFTTTTTSPPTSTTTSTNPPTSTTTTSPPTTVAHPTTAAPGSTCQAAMVSGSNKVEDDQMTASSSFENDFVPDRGRLNDSKGWTPQDHNTSQYIQVFLGNVDTETVVYTDLDTPIQARCVRFNPLIWAGGIGMRIEIYGCN